MWAGLTVRGLVDGRASAVIGGGGRLTVGQWGRAMAQAGVVTGMELDIHSGLQFVSALEGDGVNPPRPHTLLPTMVGPSERFIEPDIRAFFYFTAAGPPSRTG